MDIIQKKAIYFYKMPAILVIILLFMSGCSGRINGSLNRDGSAELSLEMSLEPRMTALLRSLAALASGGIPRDRNAPVIDGPAIAFSMAAAPGIESVTLENRSPSSVAGNIRISRIDEFLALPDAAGASNGGKRFITLESVKDGDSRLSIAMDRYTAPLILAMISEDIRDYLSALMAPAATGETMSRSEYLELVGAIYGKALSDEIAAARITATIGFPGRISSVKGGVFTGAQARFNIALVDILVLEKPLEYEVIWK